MDKYCSEKYSEGDSSEEFVYDNPFLLEDDKFEREFEKTLALFDALLIGEDSLSDTFSLSSSPSSTLKLKPQKNETKSSNILNNHKSLAETLSDRNASSNPAGEERPKSFLHDEVSEFNRLLKELSETPLLNRHSSSLTLGRPNKSRPTHHHSFSVPAKSFPELLVDRSEINKSVDDSSKEELPNLNEESNQETSSPSDQNSIKRQSFKNILESGFFESLKLFQPQDTSTIHQRSGGDHGGSWGSSLGGHTLGIHGDDDLIHLDGKKDESDSAYQTGSTDTLKSSSIHDLFISEDVQPTRLDGLEDMISHFNRNKAGLFVEMSDGGIYRGTIRVHLNLIQPISMRLLVPSSKLNSPFKDGDDGGEKMVKITSFPCLVNSFQDGSLSSSSLSSSSSSSSSSSLPSLHHSLPEYSNRFASFYVPPDVSKVVHVTSESTTTTVIKILLNKFQIVNNSNRFALFQRTYDKPAQVHARNEGNHSNLNLTRPLTCHMRKLRDDERPLEMLMRAVEEAGVVAVETTQFVLQEYSSGEIIWDAFSIPELKNFVAILKREEEMRISEVEERYMEAKAAITNRIKELQG